MSSDLILAMNFGLENKGCTVVGKVSLKCVAANYNCNLKCSSECTVHVTLKHYFNEKQYHLPRIL